MFEFHVGCGKNEFIYVLLYELCNQNHWLYSERALYSVEIFRGVVLIMTPVCQGQTFRGIFFIKFLKIIIPNTAQLTVKNF